MQTRSETIESSRKAGIHIPTLADFPAGPSGACGGNRDQGRSVRREVLPVKKYELIFILKADQPESEMEARVEKVKEILAAHEGEITQENHWGVRRLAYEIEHENKGNYMFLKYRANGTAVADLDKQFRLDDQILRHLIVVDEEWEERNRAARAKRNIPEPEAAETAADEAPAAE